MERRIRCDFCVVGAGLMGSAAAKYLQMLNPSSSVVLVGPSEPKNREGTDIFGAHYDEGRIARELDGNSEWNELDREAIANYKQITEQSGYRFYHPCGWLAVSTDAKDDLVERCKRNAEGNTEMPVILNDEDLKNRFPYLDVTQGAIAIFLSRTGGHINPRVLLKAQKRIAKNHGCQIVDDIVDKIQKETSDCHVLRTASGKEIYAKRVLLATGAFTECRSLLPKGILPAMNSTTETVLFVEVSGGTLSNTRNMPCIVSTVKLSSGMMGYILPPIQYPDGKYYIKIGHFKDYNIPLSPTDIAPWFRGNYFTHREKTKDHLLNIFRQIFPDIPMTNYYFDYCSTVQTSSNYPFIDLLNSSFGVAIGGCGNSAKCSDEIGKIAARMLAKGSWDYELLPSNIFKFRNRIHANL